MDITGEQIENYIINELDSKPRHNCMALAEAITNICDTQNIFEFNQGGGELMPNRIWKHTPLRNATRF